MTFSFVTWREAEQAEAAIYGASDDGAYWDEAAQTPALISS